MDTKFCMNSMCGITSTLEWKKGWSLRSGGFADLCYDCGCAYENYIFCETFHSRETGWRECTACDKLLHCGCIVSKFFIELMDYGGVKCMDCRKDHGFSSPSVQIQKAAIPINLRQTKKDNRGMWFTSDPQKTDNNFSETGKNLQFENIMEANKDANVQEVLAADMASTRSSSATSSSKKPMGSPDWVMSAPLGKGSEAGEVIPMFTQGKIVYDISKRPNTCISQVSELNTGLGCLTHIGRPPAEGRTRNQLLSRYWPRITDQELQRLSGDLNSTIVPLFEKILSASDASRIGRLVLPKACAEAYLPRISQSEGVPLKIVDVKGTEWTFQFRFWPNNNSRMYVLEGVTPCIQSMQLEAGDTVTFSRVDPGGKYVMGFRKAAKSLEAQMVRDSGFLGKGGGFCDGMEDVPSENTLVQTWRGSLTTAENGGCVREKTKSEKTRSRNIGSKTKRLLMPSEDVWELRITWEEAQDMLLPPPFVKPTVVMIENHKFEEYDEPPVFGAAGELVQQDLLPHICHHNLCDRRVICSEQEEKKAAKPDKFCETDSEGKHKPKWFREVVTGRKEGVSRIDLNYDPKWEEGRVSMIRLVREASLPLDEYMRENGLESLVQEAYQVLPCRDSGEDMG